MVAFICFCVDLFCFLSVVLFCRGCIISGLSPGADFHLIYSNPSFLHGLLIVYQYVPSPCVPQRVSWEKYWNIRVDHQAVKLSSTLFATASNTSDFAVNKLVLPGATWTRQQTSSHGCSFLPKVKAEVLTAFGCVWSWSIYTGHLQ